MAIFYTPLGLPTDRRDSLNCQPPREHRRSTDSEEHAGIHVDTHHGLVCQAHISQDYQSTLQTELARWAGGG